MGYVTFKSFYTAKEMIECRDRLQNGRKYLRSIHLAKGWYPE
jgi:hypothetical protein